MDFASRLKSLEERVSALERKLKSGKEVSVKLDSKAITQTVLESIRGVLREHKYY